MTKGTMNGGASGRAVRRAAGVMVAVCLLVVGGGAFAGCDGTAGAGGGGGTTRAATRPGGGGAGGAAEVPVSVVVAEGRDVERVIEEIANVAAVESVEVRAQVTGVLTAVRVKDGQEVRKGDVLFELDRRPFEAALAEAKAELAATQADLEIAGRDVQRLAALPAGAASAQELDRARAAVQRGTAQIAVDEAKIRTAEINLSYATIASPIDGRLGKVMVTAGNLINAGGAVLGEVRSFDPVYVDFTTPEGNLAEVRAAMTRGEAEVEVSAPGVGGGTGNGVPAGNAGGAARGAYTGKLTFIDNQVMSEAGLVRLRAVVGNGEKGLWPGQFVRVRLVTGVDRGVVLVPADALDQSEAGARTYVVTPEGKAELRRLKLGRRINEGGSERVVVLEGLKAGERVVVRGRWLIRPGAGVVVRD